MQHLQLHAQRIFFILQIEHFDDMKNETISIFYVNLI